MLEIFGWMIIGHLLFKLLGYALRRIKERLQRIKRWRYERNYKSRDFIKKTEEKVAKLLDEKSKKEKIIKKDILYASSRKARREVNKELRAVKIKLFFYKRVLQSTEHKYLQSRLKSLRTKRSIIINSRRKDEMQKEIELIEVDRKIREIEIFLDIAREPKRSFLKIKKRAKKNQESTSKK